MIYPRPWLLADEHRNVPVLLPVEFFVMLRIPFEPMPVSAMQFPGLRAISYRRPVLLAVAQTSMPLLLPPEFLVMLRSTLLPSSADIMHALLLRLDVRVPVKVLSLVHGLRVLIAILMDVSPLFVAVAMAVALVPELVAIMFAFTMPVIESLESAYAIPWLAVPLGPIAVASRVSVLDPRESPLLSILLLEIEMDAIGTAALYLIVFRVVEELLYPMTLLPQLRFGRWDFGHRRSLLLPKTIPVFPVRSLGIMHPHRLARR